MFWWCSSFPGFKVELMQTTEDGELEDYQLQQRKWSRKP
jgi:hypothetical protein